MWSSHWRLRRVCLSCWYHHQEVRTKMVWKWIKSNWWHSSILLISDWLLKLRENMSLDLSKVKSAILISGWSNWLNEFAYCSSSICFYWTSCFSSKLSCNGIRDSNKVFFLPELQSIHSLLLRFFQSQKNKQARLCSMLFLPSWYSIS